MATDRTDISLSFILKNEQDAYNDSDSDINLTNVDNLFSMPLPSLSVNNSVILNESNNEFLHLTTMVRAVYLSYLHKCLLNNYVTCYKQENDIPSIEVKKCADQMELSAVQLALEASLYRQNMLKMIADVKSHTVKKKAYKKLVIFLETSKDKIDVAVQTDNTWMDLHGDNIQSICITSNCEEALQTASSTINFSKFYENEDMKSYDNETDMQMLYEKTTKKECNNTSQRTEAVDYSQIMDDNITTIRNENEDTQDSLLQHMEDMFCESDDSSDLMKLIEKHSGVTKANIDKEISEICLKADNIADSNNCNVSQSNNVSESNIEKRINTNKDIISFSYYKKIQNRRVNKPKEIKECETIESKQKQRINAVWFVERVHQVLKLKNKMTELSLTDYRKHEKVKEKFLHLFGKFEEEEMISDSPICIEEYLPACKERIAPWIVKYLMPFFKKRRIKNRQLFKTVAKYIADMLIIENTFPGELVINRIFVFLLNDKMYNYSSSR